MKDKRNILLIALAVFLMGVGLPAVSVAVDVFAECAYTDVDVECYIYANTGTDELRSGGVKLIYATDQFDSNPTATKNTADWYFGDPTGTETTYDYPNSPDTSTDGEAVIIVGKLDTRTGPPDQTGVGVSGARVLIGTVRLVRSAESDPASFGLGLTFGIDDGVGPPPDDGYVNFVNTDGDDLDNGGVDFNHPGFGIPVVLRERGDANASGGITPSDINAVKGNIGDPDAPVWADCNGSGSVTPSDINCVKGKIF